MTSRRAGILFHPTSLPGPHGIGDLGDDAVRFLRWAEEAGQSVWQILPLGPTGFGNSPYGALSAFAINPLLVSPERLFRDGLLQAEDLNHARKFNEERVDFNAVTSLKDRLLRRAFATYKEAGRLNRLDDFRAKAGSHYWLDDFVLFQTLKEHFGGRQWSEWPEELARRDKKACARIREELREAVDFHTFVQMVLRRQWDEIRGEAHRRHITIIGDIPIYVAYDSADVWAHPDLFDLDEKLRPRAVAGVPPDYFSETGQRWGNPLYRWDKVAKDSYRWWIERIRVNLELTDMLRLDHFRGFAGYWEVPAHEKTAVKGQWRTGPGAPLFDALERALGPVSLVLEDLGTITPDVEELRRKINFPGMRVLQFGFGSEDNIHLTHHFEKNLVAYTGTHDNDTTRGWFDSADALHQNRALAYLGGSSADIVWSMIRAAYTSVADLVVVPLQDIFDLGSDARMNTPGDAEGNWGWRATHTLLSEREVVARVRRMAVLSGRRK